MEKLQGLLEIFPVEICRFQLRTRRSLGACPENQQLILDLGHIETRHVSDTWKCGSLSLFLPIRRTIKKVRLNKNSDV